MGEYPSLYAPEKRYPGRDRALVNRIDKPSLLFRGKTVDAPRASGGSRNFQALSDGGPCDSSCNAPECECAKSCGDKCACIKGLPEGATCCADVQCNSNRKCVGGKCGGALGLCRFSYTPVREKKPKRKERRIYLTFGVRITLLLVAPK